MIRPVLLGLLGPGMLLATVHGQTRMRFPTVKAYSLAKAKVTLPAELKGKENLLVLSFDVSRGPEVDRWLREAESLERLHAGLRYYVLPVSGRENDLYRWWQNSSMRGSYNDPQEWPWIVPLYVNRKQFRSALQIAKDRTVVVLLTDQQGNVLWRTDGKLTQEKQAALNAAISR
jgi:hypothetical protein